jgi:proteasome lid subunit RPN8/RPN11
VAGADMILTPEEWAQIREQAEAEYPAECCGVVLTRGGAERLLLPCRNIQNELHASDPVRHARDARTAYFIDPKDLLAIGRREAQGYRVDVIYHSHIEAGAYFSPTDKQNALINGDPAYPEATYVVVSVVERTVVDARAFAWEPGARDFAAVEFTVP